MRITIWSSTSFDVYSAERHIMADRIEGLVSAGHSVQLVQKDLGGGGISLQGKNIQITSITTSTVRKTSFASRYFEQIMYYFRSARCVNRETECIFVQSNYAAWLPVILVRMFRPKVRIVYNVQDIFPENALLSGVFKRKNCIYSVLHMLQRASYRCASEVVTISEDMHKTLITAGSSSDRTQYIYNWGPRETTKIITDEENLFLADYPEFKDSFCVLYAGNIGAMQNVEIIVHAAKYLRDLPIEFLIVGEGVRKQGVCRYVEENRLTHVHVIPRQSEKTAWHMYCMADINLITLVKDGIKVALPSKTASCLMAGRYIIAAIGTESQFGKKLMGVEGCCVVGSENALELAHAIRCRYMEVNKSAERYDRKEFCHAFSAEKGVADYLSIIEG